MNFPVDARRINEPFDERRPAPYNVQRNVRPIVETVAHHERKRFDVKAQGLSDSDPSKTITEDPVDWSGRGAPMERIEIQSSSEPDTGEGTVSAVNQIVCQSTGTAADKVGMIGADKGKLALNLSGSRQSANAFAVGQPAHDGQSTGGLGSMQSGARETSNVDLTTEMLDLIVAQKNFEANAKGSGNQFLPDPDDEQQPPLRRRSAAFRRGGRAVARPGCARHGCIRCRAGESTHRWRAALLRPRAGVWRRASRSAERWR